MEAQLLPCLQQTLNPVTARRAEQALRSAECQSGFAISLLKLVASSNVDNSSRQAAALFFKNFIKRAWKDDEGDNRIPAADCAAVKSEIIGLMISLPPILQVQLGEAVTIIADSDFPENWPELMDDLVSRLSPDDMVVNNGVLQTAHSIFKRWRSQFRSDVLFTEIKFVLDRFCNPFFDLLKRVDELIEQNARNAAALRVLLQTLFLISKISFDLNCQDLPEFFEDNLTLIFGTFHKYLTYTNPLMETDDDEETGPIEKVKASILELVDLYTMRFEEDFSMLPEFANTTWTLLTSTGLEMKHDILVSKALSVLTSVSKSAKHAALFASEDVMRQIVEKIILPNMSLRTSDEELFEEDPIEFIRRDLEGSDSDTRRRASADFIRGLMDKFESMITGIVMSYIQHYLNEFQVNPTAHWKSQDTAIYLLTSISTKGHISQHGVTSTNILVDIVDFLDKNILPSLTAPLDSIHPILKVDALKFVYTFRNQLTKDQLASVLPLFVNHLESSSYVVYTYAAICIERVLFLKRDNAFVILEPDIAPHIRTLLASLFKLIERGNTTQKLAENDFLMRCVMRVIISSHNAVVLHAQLALAHLNAILVEISKNPSNPRFNHFTFESLGALIRFTVPTSPDFVSQFETALIPTFQYILVQDVAEFTPYVFQLLAQLLEAHNEPGLTEQYKSFLVPFLSPSLWESKGNIPALVRLLEAYLLRGSEDIIAAKQIEPLLGIFQKLLASKLHDHHGFDLLQSMFIQLPLIALQPYIKQIVILLFTRLNASRTEKFTQRFALLIYLLMALEKPGFGPNFVIASMDEVQPGIFGQVFENFVLPETQKIHGSLERKTTSIGLTRLLVESEAMQAGGPYAELWHLTLMTILKLFELPQEAFDGQDIEEIDPDLDFQVSFAKLGTAARLKPDHFVAIPDPKRYLAERLGQSNQSAGGKIAIAIQTRLPQDAQSVLSSYGLVF